MKNFINLALLAFITAILSPAPQSFAQSEPARLWASCQPVDAGENVACDLRVTDLVQINEVTVASGTSSEGSSVKLQPYNPAQESTAWLFLIDRSNPARRNTIERVKEAVSGMIDRLDANDTASIATFADNLETLAAFTTDKAALKNAVSQVSASGLATELYRLALDGIRLLRNQEASRRVLVLISDGKAEDKAFTLERVVEEAIGSGVAIFSLGYPERATETPDLQIMRRLSTETGGIFAAASLPAKELPEDFSVNFARFLETGGSIKFPAQTSADQASYTIVARFADGRVAQVQPAVVFEQPFMEDIVGWLTRQYEEGSAIFWGIVAVAAGLLLLALLALFGVLPARKPDVPADAPKTMSKSSKALAWLEPVEGGEKIAIKQTVVRIGRGSDNDIQLDADNKKSTVHRRHATIHITPKNEFIVTDLSGEKGNGIVVNSKKVERQQLSSGDTIEFGLVKYKFTTA